MANEDVPSPVATAVTAALDTFDEPLGAIMLRGYLWVEPPSAQRNKLSKYHLRRLYTDGTFRNYFEFTRKDMLHHQQGDQKDMCCPMGIVWLRYEAKIKRVSVGYAYAVAGAPGPGSGHGGPWGGHGGPWGGHGGPWGGHGGPWGMNDDPGGGHGGPWG